MEQKAKNKEELEIQLFTSLNEYEITEVCAILTENNIPYIRINEGSGSYINLYMGQSIQEKKIFVSKDDYDKSLELLSLFTSNNTDTDKETEEISIKNDDTSKYKLIRRGLGFIILGMPLSGIILAILISLMYN